jgi:hypothetical protein
MKSIRDMANLDHSCHAMNIVACDAHVNAAARFGRLAGGGIGEPDTATGYLSPKKWNDYNRYVSRTYGSGVRHSVCPGLLVTERSAHYEPDRVKPTRLWPSLETSTDGITEKDPLG